MTSGEARSSGTPEADDHKSRARAAAARAARESYGKLVAFLAAPTRDVPGAEDALADAFAAALAAWPAQGVPANPEGWLATTARRRMIDAGAPAAQRRQPPSDTLALIDEELKAAEARPPIPDRRLALMFACAHPAIEEVDPRAPDAADDSGPRRGGDRVGLPRLARRDGPAARPRQGEDPPRRRAVPDPGARGSARTARRRARRDLRRLFARLGGGVLRRSARPRPRRGGDLARPRRRRRSPPTSRRRRACWR